MPNCSPSAIVAALHEQGELISDIVRQEIEDSPNLALRLIADGGVVRRSENSGSVIYGEAKQASVAYKQVDHKARPITAASPIGQFPGKLKNNSAQGLFNNYQNEIDDNACNGQFTIDFAQGFKLRGYQDYELALDTPVKCSRELDRMGEAHIRGYFNGVKNQFTRWGTNNFSDNLLNLVIQNGEANASVIAANQFNVTSGGFQGPPKYRMSIHFLQDYRDYIVATKMGNGMKVSEDFMLEVEMPRADWKDAVLKDQLIRNPAGTVYNNEVFKDSEGPLRGREFDVYGGIKCYFNERPIRGYFKQNGTVGGKATFSFVRVYEWINVLGEVGGLVSGVNHQYRADSILVDGVRYDMCTLIPHVDPLSFKRHGLLKPIKPIGESNSGVNYEVKVIDGANLEGNNFNDKFKLAARHEFRFVSKYPELSGFIAYRHGQRLGYVLDVTARNYVADKSLVAFPENYRSIEADLASQAECAQCGKVALSDGTCVAPESVVSDVLSINPSGAQISPFSLSAAKPYTVTLAVNRKGKAGQICSVNYATTGTNVGPTFTPITGTLVWEADDLDPKFIVVSILGTTVATDNLTVTLSAPVGAGLNATATSTVVSFVNID